MALRREGFSLLEIIIAVGILTVILLGVVATLSTANVAQATVNERLAATTAGAGVVDEISSFSRQGGGFDALTSYHQTGFPVHHSPGEIGYVSSGTAGPILALKTASPALFPASRATAPAGVQLLPGYVEVLDVAGRTDLRDVQVTVAWKSISGAGSEEKVVFFLRVTR